jgi:hypothetical protein
MEASTSKRVDTVSPLILSATNEDTKNEFDVKLDECVARVREIIDSCEDNGQKFFDQSFLPDTLSRKW